MKKDIKNILKEINPNKNFTAIQLNGGKNNEIYKISFEDKKEFVLKKYYYDKKHRLKNEWNFLHHVRNIYPRCVPKPIIYNEKLNIAIYSFINGNKLQSKEINKEALIQACKFIKKINQIPIQNKIQNATECCLKLEDHLDNISFRIFNFSQNLNTDNKLDKKISNILKHNVIPLWKQIQMFNKKTLFSKKHSIKKFLSPSDFGFHNIIKSPNGNLMFLDFEYSGIDDLAKLTNDFFCVPEIPVNKKYYKFFISEMLNNLNLDDNFLFRVENLLYSYKLKWICIMLKQLTYKGILKRNLLKVQNSSNSLNSELNNIQYKFDKLKTQFSLET